MIWRLQRKIILRYKNDKTNSEEYQIDLLVSYTALNKIINVPSIDFRAISAAEILVYFTTEYKNSEYRHFLRSDYHFWNLI